MAGQLQVRQISLTNEIEGKAREVIEAGVGRWTDVQSAGWLMGYMIPHMGLAYEFRYAPGEPDLSGIPPPR